MFRRGLAILLCSTMLVGSLPETSFAAENVGTTETVEAETQENGDSLETEENAQTSKVAVSETQTVAETETKETETTETKAAEGDEDVSADLSETAAQETEKTETKETETVTNPTEEQTVIETTMETEETTIVETEEESTEEMTEEEMTEEIENAEEQSTDAIGNEYITISNVKVTYNSISFDYDPKGNDLDMYVENTKSGGKNIYSKGNITITGLNPSTEYNIYFTEWRQSVKLYAFSKTTAECPYNVKYDVTSTKADTITIAAEITAKEGAEYELPERFRLNWKCFDEEGRLVDENSVSGSYISGGSLPEKITCDIQNLQYIFGDSKYKIEVWISEGYEDYSFYTQTQFAKESKEVTTAAPVVSDAEFSLQPSGIDAKYTFTTGNYKDSIEVVLFWRLKGSNEEWKSEYFSTENGSATGTIEWLSLGSTYEYIINAAGLKKTGEYTHGEAKLKWNLSVDMGALDAIVTCSIDEATKTEKAGYGVDNAVYKLHTSEYWSGDLYQDSNKKDTYIASNLYPDTEYDIKLTILEELPNGGINMYTVFETVRTKKSAVITNITTLAIDHVEFTIGFDPSVVRTDYSGGCYVYPFIKDQDGKYTRLGDSGGGDIYLKGDRESYYDYLYGLESNKTYEVSFRAYGDYDYNDQTTYEYGTMTFKTPADDRRITIDAPEVGVSGFKINGTFAGSTFPYNEGCLIVLMYKEQGTERWKYATDEYIYYDWDDDKGSRVEQKFSLSSYGYFELEQGKSYEYAVGICDGYEWNNIDKLKDVKRGTITPKPDDRSVEINDNETIQLLDGVVLKATLLGKYIDDYNTAYMFFREKGKTDASWNQKDIDFYEGQKDTTCVISSYNGEALKSSTTYEYKLSMNGNIRDKEEEFKALPISGEFTFTQPADDRALDVEVTENRNNVKFTIGLTGNKAVTNYIAIFYREKGSETWMHNDIRYSSISWQGDQISRTFNSLAENTEYEYIIGISNTWSISSPDEITIGKQTGTFSTKDNRKFGTPEITTGYSYADVKVEVEGFTTNDSADVRLYIKDTAQQDAKWVSKGSRYVYYESQYNYNKEAQFNVTGLEQGKTYDYALVLADNSYSNIAPDTTAYEKLSANRKLVGTFTTRKSDYKLEIAQNENSKYRKEILSFKAVSETFNEKLFDVTFRVSPKGETYSVYNGTIALSSIDYTADVELINLAGDTEYDVTATLYAKSARNSNVIREAVATKEYSFKTKAANAPAKDELTVDKDEVYLNNWDEYGYYWGAQVYVSAPEGVSNAVTWKSDNEAVASVMDGTIIANKPGDATITATSVLNPEATATVTVHVKNYGVVLTDKNPWEPTYGIYMMQNKQSTNIAYAAITDDGTKAVQVDAVGVSDDPGIAVWDSENQCIVTKSVGTTYIDLEADGYKFALEVAVYADAPDFDVKLSPTTTDDANYPAIKDEKGTYQIASGLYQRYYQLSVEANPKTQYYDIEDVLTFKVADTDKDVLTVDEYGYVQGLKKGTATVTVAYDMAKINALIASYEESGKDASELKELAKHTDLQSKTKTITFDVRPLYSQGLPEAHAISNIHKTLKDVSLGEGWTWRDPETPLYSLPESGSSFYYNFEAKYTGTEFYNYEGTVKVYISTITGVDVTSDSNAISAGGTDSMNLTIKPIIYGYNGLIEGKDYTVSAGIGDKDASVVSAVADTTGYKVTASSKGKYTLKPEIKVGNDVVAVGSYTFTAVDGKLVDHITVEPVTEGINKYVTIKGDTIYFDSNKGVSEFKLKATAYNRGAAESAEENTTTKLTWTITDKTVADIDAKTNDREVTIKVKGDGHAVIQVTAADEAKASVSYNVEARNHEPRFEGDKITVNTAYDYKSSEGRSLSARQYGYVSVTPVYDERISKVQVVSDTGAISTDFKATYYGSDDSISTEEYYVIAPIKADMDAGKHSAKLAVTTSSGFTYTYPLAITVINKEPKVTVKFSNTMNLFYLNSYGTLDVTLEKNKSKGTDFTIESLKWSDSANQEGFKVSTDGYSVSKTPNVKRYTVDGSKVKVSDGKLVNPSVASGTVTIKLAGVIKEYKDIPVTIKCSYKKPKLTTADSTTGKNTSTIIPSMMGGSLGQFWIYADKEILVYNESKVEGYDYYKYYNVYHCGNDKVTVTESESWSDGSHFLNFTYSGTEDKFDIPLTLDSCCWREALTVTHKVKAIKPTAVLSNAKLVYNTNYNGEVYARVTLKDYPYSSYGLSGNTYSIITAVDVTGADQASRELLTSGKLQLEYTSSGYITAKLSASKLGSTVPKGASYVLTPYYYDASTRGNKALNALSLKITFTDKPITVKVSGKGKLDLAVGDISYDYSSESWANWLANNSIAVAPKFTNLGSGYYVADAKLTGEYSKYFTLYDSYDSKGNSMQYIKISSNGRGKLKAGQNYNLSITYTLEDNGGNRITVKSNVLKVKPIQKAPKITVSGNNKSLYMASPDLYRVCEIWTPYYTTRLDKDYCIIKSAYGSIDTNKDGKADIEVKFSEHDSYDLESGQASLRIQLTKEGRHAVAATAKGKSYTIPVTVQLVGRDGITKDATVSIKVTVKK